MSQKIRAKNQAKNQQLLVIGGVVAIAIVVFGIVLYFAAPKTTRLDYGNYVADLDDNGEFIRVEGEPFVITERTTDGGFVIGNPDAAITVVAFEDFLCPHCQDYQPTIKRFIEDYVFTGRARFEFRMLPISNSSGLFFSLVECSAEVSDDPAAFWYAHDEMFALTTTNGISLQGSDFARAIGEPYGTLLDCTDTATQYQTDQALAGQYQQITGTPAVAWRLNGGNLRLDTINRRPSYDELATLVEVFGQVQVNQ